MSAETLRKLCEFYGLGVADLLEYRKMDDGDPGGDVVESEGNGKPVLMHHQPKQSSTRVPFQRKAA